MNSIDRAGRTYILAIIAAITLVSLATIILTDLVTGWQKIGQQSIRFALTVGLGVFLYRGAALVCAERSRLLSSADSGAGRGDGRSGVTPAVRLPGARHIVTSCP